MIEVKARHSLDAGGWGSPQDAVVPRRPGRPGCREAKRDDHAAVLKLWSKRYRDLGRTRTQVACRLHAVLCELIPGGVCKEITAAQAAQILASITPADAVAVARLQLAAEFTEDLRGIDAAIRETRKKLAIAVRAAGTSLTGLPAPRTSTQLVSPRAGPQAQLATTCGVAGAPAAADAPAHPGPAPIAERDRPQAADARRAAVRGGSRCAPCLPRRLRR